MKKESNNNIIIYQTKNGDIEFQADLKKDTLWANLSEIAALFGVQKPAISKHIKNIFETEELFEKATVSKMETVQKEGKREVVREIEYYNLDMIISVGYRINSKNATQFRKWATKTLKDHITKGYTLNKKVLKKNHQEFLKAVENVQKILPKEKFEDTQTILDLIKTFSATWASLDSYDKETFSQKKKTQKKVLLKVENLREGLAQLKKELIKKGEATDIFAADRNTNSLEGIFGNCLQSFGGVDVYPSIEEKAAHLLYFIVKNHPFVDGNKRSGAFAFIWFLDAYQKLDTKKINPESLTALTLLIAESNPAHKDKVVQLVMSLL